MIDHVAFLVRNIEEVLERLDLEPVGPIESFPSEGTREVYLGDEGRSARLLLMQPLGEAGPYARALRKRGPGLHHVALRTASIDAFLNESTAGWLMHPSSFETRAHGTIWMARPGIGTLLEVVEQAKPLSGARVVERVEVPAPPELMRSLDGLGVEGLVRSPDEAAWITVNGQRLSVADLVG